VCVCVALFYLRQVWGLYVRICWIQFTQNFIEFILVETNQLFGSNTNVILTRQTCGLRSSRVAGLLKQMLSASIWYFPIRICYMFLISKGIGKSDLVLCITLVLVKRMPLRSADFHRILRPNTFSNRKSALRSGILFASTELMHKPRSDSPLYFFWHISSLRSHTRFVRISKMPALGVCLPQRGYWDSARLLGESCWQKN